MNIGNTFDITYAYPLFVVHALQGKIDNVSKKIPIQSGIINTIKDHIRIPSSFIIGLLKSS